MNIDIRRRYLGIVLIQVLAFGCSFWFFVRNLVVLFGSLWGVCFLFALLGGFHRFLYGFSIANFSQHQWTVLFLYQEKKLKDTKCLFKKIKDEEMLKALGRPCQEAEDNLMKSCFSSHEGRLCLEILEFLFFHKPHITALTELVHMIHDPC